MQEKINTFGNTFRGRRDVVAKYYQSKTGEPGYSPLCKNEWKQGVCNKCLKKPCRTCLNADYIPLSDQLILDHFKGNQILGIYPLLKDNTCWFIAGDFDNHTGDRDPLEDVKVYYEACQMQDIPCYVLRSKSGAGYHAYIFFSSPLHAWKARIVAFALLKEAQIIGEDIELSSFDRLFPNQDELTGKGFGNLIALPFQGKAARNEHTKFLDPDSDFIVPFYDQWGVLAGIEKIGETVLDDLIKSWNLERAKLAVSGSSGKPNPEGWLLEALKGVKEADPGRDATGAQIAGYFVNKLPKKDVLTILLAWNTRNEPPLPETDIYKITESVERYKQTNNGDPNVRKKERITISLG